MLTETLKKKGYKIFRNYPFIDREEEINFLKEYFKETPQRILFIYGPKSTGKTTLIEYVIEKELKEKGYWINYLNLRRTLLATYENFIYSFFEEAKDETETELNRTYDLKIFKLEAKTLKKIKERRINLFAELIRQFEKIKEKKIFIIDEIQVLEDIYVNGEKELLKEFLNFCVTLTKETHLAHVVILTSNTIFLNRIYNDSKLKETSDFKLIEHPEKEIIVKMLKDLGYNNTQIELAIDYYGTIISRFFKMYQHVKPQDSIEKLKEYLDKEKLDAKMQIIEILKRYKKYNLDKDAYELFIKTAKKIINTGLNFKDLNEKEIDLMDVFCEKEILFFDPQTGIITPNSRIYLKAMEDFIKER